MKKLKRLLTKSGKITIAALDHRGSLEEAFHPDNPKLTTREEMLSWKKMMVDLYKDFVSGILIDPIYGKEIVKRKEKCGFMLSMEKTGYRGNQLARETELLPNWGVRKAKEMGASGVKLLLYYDPDNRELARKQKKLAETVAEECQKQDVVFLLEPLSYKKTNNHGTEVLKIARDLKDLAVDVWKFEYPGSKEGCREITKTIKQPWVLLSAGMKFEKYKQALQTACESGAIGMAVGRAVWREFGKYTGRERERFLREESVGRMKKLVEVVERFGGSE